MDSQSEKDLNLVLLAGRLASAPALEPDDAGSRVLRMLLTVRARVPRSRIDVIPVRLWDPPDDLLTSRPATSDRMWVVGAVQRTVREDHMERRSRLEVVAHHVATDTRPELDCPRLD